MLKWAKAGYGAASLGVGVLLVVIAALAVAFGGAAPSARGEVSVVSGQATAITDGQAVGLARAVAAQDGENAPSAIEMVRSTHALALRYVDPGETTTADDGNVVVLVLHGHFTASQGPHPPGAAPPSGSVMTLVLDAASGQLRDLGLVDAAPSLAALGPVSQAAG